MRLYNVHTLEQTNKKIKESFNQFEVERISIQKALNRIITTDLYAEINVPSFNRSTVDGYAVRSNDVRGASETMPMLLNFLGEVQMGETSSFTIDEDTCVYVPTGGLVPSGADSMVMIEYTEKFGDQIAIMKPALPLQSIIQKGDDVKKGDCILKKGTRLNARHIGVLASTGIFHIEVYKKITAVIISTGDELITTETKLLDGQVYDINTYTIENHSKQLDLEVLKTFVLKDDYNTIKDSIEYGIENADITIVSGGSSVGHKDYTADIIDDLAQGSGVMIHGLAIKPGKPTIVGKVKNKLVLGLPGHPVSALIVYDQLIRMYLSTIHHYKAHKIQGVLTQNLHSAPGKETFVMVKVGEEIEPVLGKSGMITMMSEADGYIKIGENTEGLSKGDLVTVTLFE